jgi:hypothetical protein
MLPGDRASSVPTVGSVLALEQGDADARAGLERRGGLRGRRNHQSATTSSFIVPAPGPNPSWCDRLPISAPSAAPHRPDHAAEERCLHRFVA